MAKKKLKEVANNSLARSLEKRKTNNSKNFKKKFNFSIIALPLTAFTAIVVVKSIIKKMAVSLTATVRSWQRWSNQAAIKPFL